MTIDAAVRITKERIDNFLRPGFKFLITEEEGDYEWSPPLDSAIKINCDGSWLPESRRAGLVCVAFGIILGAKSSVREGMASSFDTEGVSVCACNAMSWASEERWDSCIFEIDNVDVFNTPC